MTNVLDRFAHYAFAFEQAFAADDWGPLAEHFTDGAVYETFGAAPLAGRARGRAAVVDRLRTLVGALDRRFDLRLPEILAGPDERDGGAWMRFGLTLQRAALPDLRITGDHTVYVEGERISRIEEYVPVVVCEAVAVYLSEHSAQLKPAAASLAA